MDLVRIPTNPLAVQVEHLIGPEVEVVTDRRTVGTREFAATASAVRGKPVRVTAGRRALEVASRRERLDVLSALHRHRDDVLPVNIHLHEIERADLTVLVRQEVVPPGLEIARALQIPPR